MEDIKFNIKEFVLSLRRSLANRALTSNPYLVILQIGNNAASEIYVKNKVKACKECNINVYIDRLPDTISENDLLLIIDKYNKMNCFTGILVQMPLPRHICEEKVCKAIDPNKDVDGFNPINVGNHVIGSPKFIPATVLGISLLLSELKPKEWYYGKKCVIVGRSNIAGKPMAVEMLNKFNCTTTICHSYSNLKELKDADIVIVAVGKPKFITSDMIKEGAIVIDVGINRDENNKIVGDVDYNSAKDKASYVTPVPGGVGPLTITGLIYNTIKYL